MQANYFDTLTHWEMFEPFLTHPTFLEYATKHANWASYPADWKNKPQAQLVFDTRNSETGTASGLIEFYPEEVKEIDALVELAYTHGPSSPFWWCALYDNVDANALMMAALVSLSLRKRFTELYVVSLKINGQCHQVISDKPVRTGRMITCRIGHAFPSAPTFYDLVLPISNPKNRRMLNGQFMVTSCSTVARNHKEMNYNQDWTPEDQNLPPEEFDYDDSLSDEYEEAEYEEAEYEEAEEAVDE